MKDFKLKLANHGLSVELTIRLTDSISDVLFIDASYNGKFLLHDTFHMPADVLESIVDECDFTLRDNDTDEIVPLELDQVDKIEQQYQKSLNKVSVCAYCDLDVHWADGYKRKGEWFCNEDHANYWDYGTDQPESED